VPDADSSSRIAPDPIQKSAKELERRKENANSNTQIIINLTDVAENNSEPEAEQGSIL
jgi:hypothetical protein